MAQKAKKHTKPTMAECADRHALYEMAVQCVEAEIDMVDETFTEIRGREASILREDFCGTANTSCEWVRRRETNRAIGIDLDREVLDWGIENNIGKLTDSQQQRIQVLNEDVLKYEGDPADIVLAMNFSYQIFKTRDDLRRYFQRARDGLGDDGVLFIDAYGGHDSWRAIKEKTKHKGFTYYWDQAEFDPITFNMNCHIHFKFKDGSRLNEAFSYDWRTWTLPELREILTEAGFRRVTVYWEGTDEKSGEGNGIYSPAERGDDDPSWIVYLSAEK